jgi:GntR family transcriptional regulator
MATTHDAEFEDIQRSARYVRVARALMLDISEGRLPMGGPLPTEAELQARFGVSRHTVRQALRELKDRGLVSARAGIGTWVRALPSPRRFVQTSASVEDLLRFSRETRFRLIGHRVLGSEESPAEFGGEPVSGWLELDLLRFVRDAPRPLARLTAWLRPAYADIVPLIETAPKPIFKLIEERHGDAPVEIRQEITAVLLGDADAHRLEAAPGEAALRIVRSYFDAQDRLIEVAVGVYPSDRFSQSSTLRLERRAAD